MPAKIVVYSKPTDIQDYERFVSSPNTYMDYFTRNVYSSPDCTTIIGVAFYESTFHTFSKNLCVYGDTFIKFFKNSGFPYGDDNILVISGTNVNKIVKNDLIDGTYIFQVNSAFSSGEYQGQVGNATFTRNKKSGLNDVTVINFPLPIVTYTNAFNSLPQPSTAPLPA